MKRILDATCAVALIGALVLFVAGTVPARAAEAAHDVQYYPIAVEEYTDGEVSDYRILKIYQLARSGDPSGIPTDDFERYGYTFHLLDMTRKDELGVERIPWSETVTKSSDTNNMEKVLQQLDAEMDVTTEDGHSGTLHLDHTSVQIAADGYTTKTQELTATRTYPNLSSADVSLLPRSIEDNGHTLSLSDDVKWEEALQTEADGTVLRYSATAVYTGSASTRQVTGYTVTANYVGEVSKTDTAIVTYTAIFGVIDPPVQGDTLEDGAEQEDQTDPEPDSDATAERELPAITKPVMLGALALVIAGAAFVVLRKIRGRR